MPVLCPKMLLPLNEGTYHRAENFRKGYRFVLRKLLLQTG